MKAIPVILAVACAVMVVGAAVAYCYQPGTGFSVSDDGSGSATVSVSGTLPSEIAYRLLSGTEIPERIYLFLDPDYTGGFVSYRDQDKMLSSLKDMMSDRGYCTVEFIDSERLAQLCTDPSAAPHKGIMMISGAIPANVYPDVSNNGLETWMSNGGTVYWAGPDMGLYRADADGNNEKVEGGGRFGDAVNNSDDKPFLVGKASPIADAMGFACGHAEYGLKADYPGSVVLGLYDDYSSLSVVPAGLGRIYVLGCPMSSLDVESLYTYVDMIVCGITENTVVKDTGRMHKGYGNDSFTVSGIAAGDVLYVTSGKPVSVNGKVFGF